ncbi:MAG TPA: hypothetical protein VFW71_10705 [Actinomycetota bacterium]|nr:hypothetical protein [Actinomycetota bacterium]
MTRAPRLAAGLLGALLTVAPFGFAGSARAAASPCTGNVTTFIDVSVTDWQSPSGATDDVAHQCTPDSGTTLTGTYQVHFDSGSLDSLSSFSVAIVPGKGIPALPASATVSHNYKLLASTLSDTIAFAWNTATQTPYNGVYSISATAVSLLGDVASSQVSQLSVNNPPSTPSKVAAVLAGGQPTVTWAANPEPDITGYEVLRSTGGAYSPIGTVNTTTFNDPAAPQGSALTYEVIAVRSSPLTKAGISSAASSPSNAVTPQPVAVQPVTLSVVAPPSPIAPPKLKPITVGGNTIAPIDNTFAPNLPFGQAIPTATETVPSFTTGSVQALAGDPPSGGTSTAQKLRYIAAAALLIVLAAFIIRFARKLLKGL